jgi:hypothetical protein
MVSKDTFKFDEEDRVVYVQPITNKLYVGTVSGRYGRYDSIALETHTVLATTPWTEPMYTVELDAGTVEVAEESTLHLLVDIPPEMLNRLIPP